MTHALRITSASIFIVLTYLSATGNSPSQVLDAGPEIVAESFTPEQQELVDFAFSQFELAAIELPAVGISFRSDNADCFGYGGVYMTNELTVRICQPSKTTMVHELAHAWVEASLDDSDRQSFLELRGLSTWTAGTEWDQRGAEQAAEIITWAVMDENISLRWLDTDSRGTTVETWRLFKIPDSDPDQLASAYQHLTGGLPHGRLLDDPRVQNPPSK